jgi:outer membrane receptor protein involved in Fe transport
MVAIFLKRINAMVSLAVLLAGSISSGTISAAGTDSTRLHDLDRMMVRAQRTKMFASDIIDSTKLIESRDTKTIDGLLTDLPGIDVKRSSPAAGKGRGVTLRGFDESRFLILLDGRPLNGCGVMGGDYVDWASLSTDNIKEIEVIRGPASAEFGNSFGGAVSIVTKDRRDLSEKTTAAISYGVVAPERIEDATGKMKTNFTISHRNKIGEIALLDLYASHGSGKPILRNNYYNLTGFGGNLSLFLPAEIEANIGLRSSIQYRGFAIENNPDSSNFDRDYPVSEESSGGGPGLSWKGGDFYFGDRSYWKNIRTQTDFSLSRQIGKLALSGRLYLNNQNRTEYFYALTDTNTLVLERFAKPEDYTWGWNIKAVHKLTDNYLLKYGVEGSDLAYNNSDIRHVDTSYFRSPPSDGPEERINASNQYSLYLQSELDFFDRLSVSPGIRYDYYIGTKRDSTMDETVRQGFSPNGTVSIGVWNGSTISITGAYRYRFPSCPELYWYYNGHDFAGRKELSPERALQVDGGISQHLQSGDAFSVDLDLRGYRYTVKDYIRTVFGGRPVPPLRAKASRLIYNIDNVTLSGMEAEVKMNIIKGLAARANYTWQMTRKEGDTFDSSMSYSDGLPELPEHKANAAVEYSWKNGVFAALSMRYVGSREVIQESFTSSGAAYRKVDSFVTFRLSGIYPAYTSDALTVKIKAGIDNLFNAEYEEYPGIPMPGITGTASVEVDF